MIPAIPIENARIWVSIGRKPFLTFIHMFKHIFKMVSGRWTLKRSLHETCTNITNIMHRGRIYMYMVHIQQLIKFFGQSINLSKQINCMWTLYIPLPLECLETSNWEKDTCHCEFSLKRSNESQASFISFTSKTSTTRYINYLPIILVKDIIKTLHNKNST